MIKQSEESVPGKITLTEVSTHTSNNDCYLVINNNICDISSYISYHPGGSRTITSRCGKEVTGIFAKIHSNRAWDLLNKLFDALVQANPNVEVIKVSSKQNFFIAKIIYNMGY